MRGNRSIFVGMLALVVAVGMLGANGYYWWLAQTRDAKRDSHSAAKPNLGDARKGPVLTENEPSAGTEAEAAWDSLDRALYREMEPESSPPAQPSRQFFPHQTEAIEIAQADKTLPPLPPPSLLLPGAAAPIAQRPAPDWLNRVIRQELPQASAEELRVWSQELQGLQPEMVRDLLRMRKSVMAETPSRLGAKPEAFPNWAVIPKPDLPPATALVPPPADDLGSDVSSVANRLQPSLAALEQARDVILNNLANANSIGFKRSRAMLSPLPYQTLREEQTTDAPHSAVSVGWGVELTGTPLDVSQGPLKKTNQPLDVAIEGPGFFQIRSGEDVFYTRCGTWTTNDQGQLCLAEGNKRLLVVPSITVPANAVSIAIAEDGTVSQPNEKTGHILPDGRREPDLRHLGTIELARFQNPAGLKPLGGHLLAATPASGPPQMGSPQMEGLGELRQGMLERSNVSQERERDDFQAIQSQWQLLKHLANTADRYAPPGPIAHRALARTQRVSAQAPQLLPPLTCEPLLKTLLDRGRTLFKACLQSKPMKTIQRTLGLRVIPREQKPPNEISKSRDADYWFKKHHMTERARTIERNLGFD